MSQAPVTHRDLSSNSGPSNTDSYSAFHHLANAAGQDPAAFAKANLHAKGRVGTLARMYYTMSGVHGDGASNEGHAGDDRTLAQRLYQIG